MTPRGRLILAYVELVLAAISLALSLFVIVLCVSACWTSSPAAEPSPPPAERIEHQHCERLERLVRLVPVRPELELCDDMDPSIYWWCVAYRLDAHANALYRWIDTAIAECAW